MSNLENIPNEFLDNPDVLSKSRAASNAANG